MPIRKEFRKFYRGAAWRDARHRILARAGGKFNLSGNYLGSARCEACGKPDRTRVETFSDHAMGFLGHRGLPVMFWRTAGSPWRDWDGVDDGQDHRNHPHLVPEGDGCLVANTDLRAFWVAERKAMKSRVWFLSTPHATGACATCTAPARGFDSQAVTRCCGECEKGCQCGFQARQREIVREMPIQHKARRATA
jgi:hypothetical protein